MLVLNIHHEDRLLTQCRIPNSYRAEGCLLLVDQSHVIELKPEEQRSCGGFEFGLFEQEMPAEAPATMSLQIDPSATMSISVIEADTDSAEGVVGNTTMPSAAAPQSDPTDDTSYVEGLTQAAESPADQVSDIPLVPVEIYPRVPGYIVQQVIGRGGMGTVWKAHQISTNRSVALKTILPSKLSRAKSKIRFKREVELAASLNHPGLATIFDSGITFGHHYYSMELIDGVSWERYIRDHRPGKPVILRQLLEVLDAIGHAHDHEVIHRDLKPSNILINERGAAVVVDFGLAKHSSRSSDDLSKQGDVLGTLNFMAPEQASGNISEVDRRADIYALGVVALHFLTGEMQTSSKHRSQWNDDRVFTDAKKSQAIKAGNSGKRGHLPRVQKQLDQMRVEDPSLHQVLSTALSLDREERYQTVRQFAAGLRGYLSEIENPPPFTSTKSVGKMLGFFVGGVLLVATGTLGWMSWQGRIPQHMSLLGTSDQRSQENADPLQDIIAPEVDPDEQIVNAKFGGKFEESFTTDGTRPPKYRETRSLGGNRDPDYSIAHPNGWPLVGLRFCTYVFRNDPIIKVAQPLFRSPDGADVQASEMIGVLAPECEYHEELAKPGYAIAGIRVRVGVRVHAIQFIYQRLTIGEQFDRDDEYSSPWYGGREGEPGQLIGCGGNIVRGVHCSHNVDVNRIALITD